ncbi:MAG: HDIG domain-containing protein [Desulfobacterium sp.]|jgi:putative nucleotidyltransferase with HDIG domain|nr:HDIG domain-containing protein [Desulfobacterium sp.]
METILPTREDAFNLLKEFNTSDSLIRHGLAVEGVMAHFAEKFGEDGEKWQVIGLVHDLDYERYPDQHCTKTREILMARNWPEEYIRAVESHGWGLCSDVKPESLVERTLYAVDELTGLISSTCLVRPSKSVLDLKVKSVTKKWKEKSFAAGVDRTVIQRGADMLGMERGELISETIVGMQTVAWAIGLKGNIQ